MFLPWSILSSSRTKVAPEKSRARNSRTLAQKLRRRLRPTLEWLEDRLAPAITVNMPPNTNVSQLQNDQAEVTIAVNPTNPMNLIASTNDLNFPAQAPTWFSTNGGSTWTLSPIPNVPGEVTFGDPTLTFDSSGNAYFGHLTSGGISVAKSVNGGLSWTAVSVPMPGGGPDKEWIVSGPDVNNLAQDRIYLGYHVNNRQFINSSSDGVTWSAPVAVQDPGTTGINAQMAVDAAGVVYMVWQDINFGTPGFGRVMFDVSFDGGLTWGTDQVIYTSNVAAFNDPFTGGQYTVPAAPTRGIGAFLSIDVDRSGGPNTGNVYVGLIDQGDLDGNPDAGNQIDHDNTDVFVIRSSDQGMSWSAPSRVNDDGGFTSQFDPWLDVDQVTGLVGVAWYDVRHDPANNILTAFYFTSSDDGGLTWEANARVSEGLSNQSGFSSFDYGEYVGLAYHDSMAYMVWADNSGLLGTSPNNQDVFFESAVVTRFPAIINQDPPVAPPETHRPVSSITLFFNTPMDQASFNFLDNPATPQNEDDVQSFTGPLGPLDDGVGTTSLANTIINSFTWLDNRTLKIFFDQQIDLGTYTIVVGPEILSSPDGFQMDQDGDGVIGEPADDQYAGTFVISLCGTDPLKGETPPEYQLNDPDDSVAGAINLGQSLVFTDTGLAINFQDDPDTTPAEESDKDFYRFQAPASGITGQVAISMIIPAGSTLDGVITLYAANGSTVLAVEDSNGPGLTETMTFSGILPGQVFFVSFGSAGGDSCGDYDFSILFGREIIVDATNPNPNPDGTPTNPFPTIQQGLALAGASAALDVVHVYGNLASQAYVWTLTGDADNNGIADGNMTVSAEDSLIFQSVDWNETLGVAGGPAPLTVKLRNNIIDILGLMRVEGSSAAHVNFTSINDDTLAGDTNGNGANSIPNRLDWGGIRYRGEAVDQGPDQTTGAFINWADIRYTGATLPDPSLPDPVGGFQFTEFSSIRMEHDGMEGTPVRVWNTTIQHGGKAIDVAVLVLEDFGPDVGRVGLRPITFVDNTLNGLYVNVAFAAQAGAIIPLSVDSHWDDVGIPYILTERLLVKPPNPLAPITLTVDQGMILKTQFNEVVLNDDDLFRFQGASLEVNGTAEMPVVFTSLTNDFTSTLPYFEFYYDNGSVDTNNDGSNSAPRPGDWGGIRVAEGHIDHAIISFGGGSVPGQGVFVNRSPVSIESADFSVLPIPGPRQVFTLSNTEITQSNGTLAQFPGDTSGMVPAVAIFPEGPEWARLIQPLARAITTLEGGDVAVIDNIIHNNLGPAAETNANANHDKPHPLGGYGVHFARNIIEGNFLNAVYTHRGGETWNINAVTGATAVTPFNNYYDDSDIVQVFGGPGLDPNNPSVRPGGLLVHGPNQVVQLQSQREAIPSNGYLDAFNGGVSASNAFFQQLAVHEPVGIVQGDKNGSFPANGDNGLFYTTVNFEQTDEFTPIAGASQSAIGNLRGEEWRQFGVDFLTSVPYTSTGITGDFSILDFKARSAALGGSDPFTAISGNNILTTSDPAAGSMELVFPNAASAVGFWVVDNEGSSPNEKIEFFDASGNLIEWMPLPTTIGGPVFVGRVSRVPIYRVVITEDPNDMVNNFYSNSTVMPLLDNGLTVSSINVPNNFSISDLDVQLNITHPRVKDLKVNLRNVATGATITLINQRGGTSGANVQNTVFDDATIGSITTAVAPFIGTFKPEAPLSTFNGLMSGGTWELRINDLATGFQGTLNSWSLTFKSPGLTTPDAMGIDDLSFVRAAGSLVVKMDDASLMQAAGRYDRSFNPRYDGTTLDPATGDPLLGGTLRILGQDGAPVLISSVPDDSVGAGPVGHVNTNTNGGGLSTGTPGSWRGIILDIGVNSSKSEFVQQLPNGTVIRTPFDKNPYTIGDEPGSRLDTFNDGISRSVQDGTFIEHADIRFATTGIEYNGYPDDELSIEGNEKDRVDFPDANGTDATAEPMLPWMFNPILQDWTFDSYSGAYRVGGRIQSGSMQVPGASLTNDVDFHLISDPAAAADVDIGLAGFVGVRVNVDVDHTLNDDAGGSTNVAIFNHEGKVVYWNGVTPILAFPGIGGGLDGGPIIGGGLTFITGTGNFIQNAEVIANEVVNYEVPTATPPYGLFRRDSTFIGLSGDGKVPAVFTTARPDMTFPVLTPMSGDPNNGFRVDWVNLATDGTITIIDIPAGTAYDNSPGVVVGGYEMELRLTSEGLNREDDAIEPEDGEVIIRQNLIRDFSNAGVQLQDHLINFSEAVNYPSQNARFAFATAETDPATGRPFVNPDFLIPGVDVYNNVILTRDGTAGVRTIESQVGIPQTSNTAIPVPTRYDRIIANTIDNRGGTSTGIELITKGGPNVLNNIVTRHAIGLDAQDFGNIPQSPANPTRAVVNFNLFFQNGINTQGSFNTSAPTKNIFGQDPLLADPTQFDYRLRFGSPASEASISDLPDRLGPARFPDEATREPNDDYRTVPRVDDTSLPNVGGGQLPFFDIGAFEFNERFIPGANRQQGSNNRSLRVVGLSTFTSTGLVGPNTTITITFSGRVAANTLTGSTVKVIRVATGATLPIDSITDKYDVVTDRHTFTISLTSPALTTGTYCLILDGTSTGPLDPAVRDIGNFLLDGEFGGYVLPSGNGIPGGDFQYCFSVLTAELGGIVFNDADGDAGPNGTPEVGEPGIANVRLNLRYAGADGMLDTGDDLTNFAPILTNATGLFNFVNLQPGLYRVSVDATSPGLVNMELTTCLEPQERTVGIGQVLNDVHFGYRQDLHNAQIGNLVWSDTNGNRIQDAGEAGIGGIRLNIQGIGRDCMWGTADDVFRTTTTAANGSYNFTGLTGMLYRVTVNTGDLVAQGFGTVPTTLNQSPPLAMTQEFDLKPGQNSANVLFSDPPRYTKYGYVKVSRLGNGLTDRVFEDQNNNGNDDGGTEPGFPSPITVFVDLDNDTLLDANEPLGVSNPANFGLFTINAALPAGTYNVRLVIPPGHLVTTPYPRVVTITPAMVGGTITVGDFGLFEDPQTGVISGRVFNDVDGDRVDDGIGTEPGLHGPTTVFIDVNGNNMLDGSDITATTLNANGVYSFLALLGGTYRVFVQQSTLPNAGQNWVLTSLNSNPKIITIAPGATSAGNGFGFQDQRASISGVIWDDNGQGGGTTADGIRQPGEIGRFSGVVVFDDLNNNGVLDAALNERVSGTTDATGAFTISDVGVGTHHLRILSGAPAGFGETTPVPLNVVVSTSTQVLVNSDIGLTLKNGAISGLVFVDTNGNGVRDIGEDFGVTGARVTLDINHNGIDGSDPFVITTSTGLYSFGTLVGGTYLVDVVAPPGGTVSTPHPANVFTDGNSTTTKDWGVIGLFGGIFYLTFATGGTVNNSDGTTLTYANTDIVRLKLNTDGSSAYTIYLKGSSFGLSDANERIDAFYIVPAVNTPPGFVAGEILVSTAGPFTVQSTYTNKIPSGPFITGFGEDVLRISPTAYTGKGKPKSANLSLLFDGSIRGLTGVAGNVDGVGVRQTSGELLLSTAGFVTGLPGGVTANGEDILRFSFGTNTFIMFFDGSNVGLGGSSLENVDAFQVVGGGNKPTIYLSTSGPFSVPGLTGGGEDVFKFKATSIGLNTTAGTFFSPVFLDGSALGHGTKNVTGFEFGLAPNDQLQLRAGADVHANNDGAVVRWDESVAQVGVYIDPTNLTLGEVRAARRALSTANAAWSLAAGKRLVEVGSPGQADVIIRGDHSTALGGRAEGVLAYAQMHFDVGVSGLLADGTPFSEFVGREVAGPGTITFVVDWNWYAKKDTANLKRRQYDFQTTALHELGHVLGLGDVDGASSSAMSGELAPGVARRQLTATDLAALNRLYTGLTSEVVVPLATSPVFEMVSDAGTPLFGAAQIAANELRDTESTPAATQKDADLFFAALEDRDEKPLSAKHAAKGAEDLEGFWNWVS